MKIVLLGEPKSTQHIYKMTCRSGFAAMYMSKEGEEIKESYQWQAKSQYMGKQPILGPLWLAINLFMGTKRRCDWDNFHKISMDALSGIIWADDHQIMTAIVRKHYDKENPRIEIEFNAIDKWNKSK